LEKLSRKISNVNVYERRTEADTITPEKWYEKTRGKRERIHNLIQERN